MWSCLDCSTPPNRSLVSKTHTKTVGIRNCLLSQISYMRDRVYLTRKFKWLIVGLDLIKMYVNPLDVIGKFI